MCVGGQEVGDRHGEAGHVELHDGRDAEPGQDAEDAVAECHETRAHGAEHGFEVRSCRAGLVVLQKRVVDVAIAASQGRAFLLAEFHDLFEHGHEGGHVFSGAGIGPKALRLAGYARDLGGEVGGDLGVARVIATHMAQRSAAYIVERAVINGLKPGAKLGRGAAGMEHFFERRHLLPPLVGCAAGHHGFLVPTQAPLDLAQGLSVALIGQKVVKGCHLRVPN